MSMIEKVAQAIAAVDSVNYEGRYQRFARAAIEAMRELSDNDLAAAVPEEDKSGAPYVVDRSCFDEHYRQMIDAALLRK